MTKSEFQDLQRRAATSGTTLKNFLRREGVAYTTLNSSDTIISLKEKSPIE